MLQVLGPWLVVLAVGAWVTWPMVSTSDWLLAGKLYGDNVVSAWYYDYVARRLAQGDPLDVLSDFNYPLHVSRYSEFPSVADAVLAAPAAWLFDWPRQYGVVQAMAVLINGLGAAWSGPGECHPCARRNQAARVIATRAPWVHPAGEGPSRRLSWRLHRFGRVVATGA